MAKAHGAQVMGVMAVMAVMETLPAIATGADLLAAIAEFGRRQAHIDLAVAELDASAVWALDGHLSMASWLRDHGRLAHRDAARWVRRGRFLRRFGAIAEAALEGRLTSSQVEAIRSVVREKTAPILEETQEGLLEAIEGLDARDTELACQEWRRYAEALVEDDPELPLPVRMLRMSSLEDGTTVGRFVLDASGAEQLRAALATARTWDGAADQRSVAHANADALVDALTFFNGNHERAGTPRNRPHVEVRMEADGSAATAGGQVLSDAEVQTVTCDCVMHRVVMAGSAVLDDGRAVRSVPSHLFRAVAIRDGGCRFPGCDRPVAWCDAHHIRWWRHGGSTSLDNLVLLCSHHHHLVHRRQWALSWRPDGALQVVTDDGPTLIGRPRGRPTIRAA